jgi:hypothetical protein
LVSQDARTRPIAHRAAFEPQIPTELLRQNPPRSTLHREGGAGKRRCRFHGVPSRSTALEGAPRGEGLTAAGAAYQ